MLAKCPAVVAALTVLFVFTAAVAGAQGNPDLVSPNIVINLPSRTLEFYSANNLIKVYPVAIGKPATPTPLGSFSVIEKEVNPRWFPPRTGEAVASGPQNPLGYRWMGFAALYGIHGTNAPWAIGGAVSNGCVRMNESDVEELFEVVPYGTPVRITYDRVKVAVDREGRASVGIYPDVYGYGNVSLGEVKAKLAAAGLGGMLSDEELGRMIREVADRQVVFARLHNIRVNGKLLAERALTFQNTLYLPVWPVAAALEVNVSWNEATRQVKGDKRAVPGVVRGDRIYISAADAQVLLGGQHSWHSGENVLDVDVVTVFLNGRAISDDVRTVQGVIAVPADVLAGAMGYSLEERDGALTVQKTRVPCVMVGDRPYIQLTRIYEVFKAYVYWNQSARSIELTYPFDVKGGND